MSSDKFHSVFLRPTPPVGRPRVKKPKDGVGAQAEELAPPPAAPLDTSPALNPSPPIKRRSLRSSLRRHSSLNERFSLGCLVRQLHVFFPDTLTNKGTLFQRAVKNVIRLQRIVIQLTSHDRKQVETALQQVMKLIQAPQNAGILTDIRAADYLIYLLQLDPVTHWHVVGSALHGLYSMSQSAECSRSMLQVKDFAPIMAEFLRSDRVLSQLLAAGIVYRLFNQPIGEEHIVMRDEVALDLLFKLGAVAYIDVAIDYLTVLENLTYHCANTHRLCTVADKLGIDFLSTFIEYLNVESDARAHLLALKVLRNCVHAIDFVSPILDLLCRHAVRIEDTLKKALEHRRAEELKEEAATARPVSSAPSEDSPAPSPVRRGSMRRGSLKYMQAFMLSEATAADEAVTKPTFRSLETTDITVEILWLMRCSPRIQRVVKAFLIQPINRMDGFRQEILSQVG